LSDYDNDPRYEFVEDGVYFDTQTNETIFVLDEEAQASIRDIMSLKAGIFEENGEDSYTLTAKGADELLGIWNSDLNEL
jgi:hypothetical protein